MAAKTITELMLDGLSCANCAAKIEERVNGLELVSSASVNFLTKTLTIETEHINKIDEIIRDAAGIVKKLEPDVKIRKKLDGSSGNEKAAARNTGENTAQDDSVWDKQELIRLGIGTAISGAAVVIKLPFPVELALFIASYLLIGGEIVLKALRNIAGGRVFDENFLMAIATAGAFTVGEFPEGVAVMLFYKIGELFQKAAVNRSRRSIRALMDIKPDYANLKTGDEIRKVSPDTVKIGEIIIVKPGERIPLDAKVLEGNSMVDTSALTGELVSREVEKGNEVLSGFINKNGLLTLEVTKEYGESTVSKILDLVRNAGSKKAPTENFITRFARYYTPAVVFAAFALAVIPPLAIPGEAFSQWVYRALIFLVVSCPCALAISIPLGFFGGIGGASRSGILVKGSNFLEALNNVDTVVFDKTGTLTKGVFKVAAMHAENGMAEEELLEYAAYAESYSNHPIAVSILKAYGKEVDRSSIESFDEVSGHGIKARVRGKTVSAGNGKLMNSENIPFEEAEALGTVVYVAVDGIYSGYIVISDELKEDSPKAIRALRNMGVRRLVMLTGDNASTAKAAARALGIDEVHAELLPQHKVEKLELLDKEKPAKGKLVFVGDGINDAPVLARADVGVAMGGLGSDAAIEAADVVLMTDEPSKLASAVKIARKTRKIVWQNIVFALGIKGIILLLGAAGMATMWEAVFADVGVAVIAILNSMRAMKAEKS